MNSKKVKEIIKFSLYKDIQNKWFIIFNIITFLGVILAINWGTFLDFINFNDKDIFKVEILDNSNIVYENFENDLSGDERFEIKKIPENIYTADNIPDELMVVEIMADEEEAFKVSIVSKEGIDGELYKAVEEELYKIRNTILAEKFNVKYESFLVMKKELSVNRVMLGVQAENSNTKEIIKIASSVFTYVISIFIFSKIANEIANEKQSKSVEYILTTVSEKEYLFAKIASNVLWLILQGLFIIVYYMIGMLLFNITKTINVDFSITSGMLSSSINSELIYYILTLVVYSVLNLILLCIIQATIASKTSSMAEAGNSVSLLLFVVVGAFIVTNQFLNPREKVSAIIYILSCVPILSAFFVPGMMAIGQASLIQIIVSLIVLIASIPIAFNYCSKIFKNGILDYTKVRKNKRKDKIESKEDYFNKRDIKGFGFVIGVSIIVYVGVQIILSLVGKAILPIVLGNVFNEIEISMIMQILLQCLSLGSAIYFVKSYTEETSNSVELKKNISIKSKGKIILISLFAVFAIQILLGILLYPLIGLDYDMTDLFEVSASSSLLSKFILIVTLSVIPAIFEETFFRKTIIDYSIKYGKVFALLFSALLFGLFHMNLSQGLFAFIMGIILGTIYVYTGDIKLTILVHFLNNGFAAFCLILPEIGVVVLTAIMLIVVIFGFIFLIKVVVKKEDRMKVYSLVNKKVDLKQLSVKYKYVFYDYTFDLSLILIVIMSIVTEKILR